MRYKVLRVSIQANHGPTTFFALNAPVGDLKQRQAHRSAKQIKASAGYFVGCGHDGHDGRSWRKRGTTVPRMIGRTRDALHTLA